MKQTNPPATTLPVDWRALCKALMDAIDAGIPAERIKQSPMAVLYDAAMAQSEPKWPTLGEVSTWVHKQSLARVKWAEKIDHHDAMAVACAAIHDFACHVPPVPVVERLPEEVEP
jgi:hypothetical protein